MRLRSVRRRLQTSDAWLKGELKRVGIDLSRVTTGVYGITTGILCGVMRSHE